MLPIPHRFLALFSLLFALLYTTNSSAQRDTVNNPHFSLAFEPGVFLPRSSEFEELYKTKSAFNWGVAIEFGKLTSPVFPWLKYSQSKFSIDTLFPSVKNPGRITATKKQYALGISSPIALSQGNFIQAKFGVSYNQLYETSTDFYQQQVGLLFSVGYYKNISRIVHFYSDVAFDYVSTRSHLQFRDWSGFIVSAGFSVDLISE